MKKQNINLIIDLAMTIILVSLILNLVNGEGFHGTHCLLGGILIFLMITHIVLHFGMIVQLIKSNFKKSK